MQESPTEGASGVVASVAEPTTQPEAQPAADVQNQEAVSQPEAASQESTPATTETQTPEGEAPKAEPEKEKAGVETADEGLVKFMKSQGLDPETATENELRLAKIARDNQKALRSSTNKKKLSESAASVDGTITREEMDAFQQEFRQYQSVKKAEAFFSEEGRDDSLAPVMSEILEEKKSEHGAAYARVLSADLPLLYDLAQIRKNGPSKVQVDPEAIRREERESINKQISASAPAQHATQNTLGDSKPQLTPEWFANVYQPGNPEHRKLVDEAMGGGK